MKFFYFFVAVFVTITLKAQNTPERIEPEDLFEKIKSSGKPAVVQFWVPNCKAKEEIVQAYKKLVEKYSSEIDFYFVGITNLPDLIIELDNKLKFNYPFYYIGGDKNKDLIERKMEFSDRLLKLLNKGAGGDFITLYIKDLRNINYDESIDVDIEKILNNNKKFVN